MEIEVEWLPFELRPEPVPLPPPDEARTREYWARSVTPLARRLGVEIHPPKARPRTRLAHEAFAFARAAGRADAMAEGLFRAHFVQGRDLGEVDTLVAVGAAAGVDEAGLRAALAARTHAAEVEEGRRLAAELGVTAVPLFWIGRYGVPGLVGADTLKQVIAEAQAEA
jgi:predicted DsbA family dithiol-disulfide isomerase